MGREFDEIRVFFNGWNFDSRRNEMVTGIDVSGESIKAEAVCRARTRRDQGTGAR